MALIVQKYGGTSVADADRMRAVAEHIAFTRGQGHDVVVVVSAMGKETDNLIALANAVSTTQPGREMDMLLTIGERKSMALLCMALADLGVEAVSFTGSQVGIITDNVHGKAKILEVKGDRVRDALAEGKVCVVAGFQGISLDQGDHHPRPGRLRHHRRGAGRRLRGRHLRDLHRRHRRVLGRSPHRAAGPQAAAGLVRGDAGDGRHRRPGPGAAVGRVRPQPPRPAARPLQLHLGAGHLGHRGGHAMEDPIISGVTHDVSEAKVTVHNVPDRPGIAARLFRALADASVNVDMIVQNTSNDGSTDISFTVPKADLAVGREDRRRDRRPRSAPAAVSRDDDIAKVSLVGSGMKTSPGIAATMFETLAANGVNIEMISTSTIRITCVVARADMERAVRSRCTPRSARLGRELRRAAARAK